MRIITRVSSCNPQSKVSQEWVNSHSAQPTRFLTEYMLNASPLAIPPKQGQSVQQGVCKIRLVGHENAAHRNDSRHSHIYTLCLEFLEHKITFSIHIYKNLKILLDRLEK